MFLSSDELVRWCVWNRSIYFLLLGGMDPVQDEMPPTVVASPIYSGLGLLPKCRREGIPQRPILKGEN